MEERKRIDERSLSARRKPGQKGQISGETAASGFVWMFYEII
jgi:hypothetical protein